MLVYATPGYAPATDNGTAVGDNLSVRDDATTTYYPGQTYASYIPLSTLLITAYADKPAEPFALNAAAAYTNIISKYSLNRANPSASNLNQPKP